MQEVQLALCRFRQLALDNPVLNAIILIGSVQLARFTREDVQFP